MVFGHRLLHGLRFERVKPFKRPTLDFSSGQDLTVHELEPHGGLLCWQCRACLEFCLLLSVPSLLALSQIKIHLKKKKWKPWLTLDVRLAPRHPLKKKDCAKDDYQMMPPLRESLAATLEGSESGPELKGKPQSSWFMCKEQNQKEGLTPGKLKPGSNVECRENG